jgi:kinesin family protein 1
VRDLFVPKGRQGKGTNLKVREHPTTGTYVEGLASEEVGSFGQVKMLLDKGNEQRVSACTSMNEVSSRWGWCTHYTHYTLVNVYGAHTTH